MKCHRLGCCFRAPSTPTSPDDPVVKASRALAEDIRDHRVWPELWFGKGGEGRPNRKRYIERVKKGIVPLTY